MICREKLTKIDYNYEFDENGMIKLFRPGFYDFNEIKTITYEKWLDNYYIIDKLNKIKKENQY